MIKKASKKAPLVIVVDGIIGSGKSTIIRECLVPILTQRGYKIVEVKEPVELWKANGRLQQFYEDPKKRSYQFQTRAFHDRVTECKQKFSEYRDTADIFLLERSIFTDILFAKMLNESGMMDNTEIEDYLDLWKMWESVMPFKPNLFIYLKPSLTACMDRLHSRNREGESSVSNDYQELLEKKHDEFLGKEFVTINYAGKDVQVPVLLLRTDSDFKNNLDVKENICDTVEKEIKKLY